jgi:His/Glu/Gln/Arg/opine family amino acid ABC transporter permease subunit
MSDPGFAAFAENLPEIGPLLLIGLVDTLKLAGGAVLIGLAFGLLVCLARISRNRIVARAALIYIEVMRGTPALVQLLLIYFGLISIGLRFEAFQAAVLGLGFNMAAYVAEILRAGLSGVGTGQKEAAAALGLTPLQSMRLVVLPQAVRIVLPPLGNAVIALVRDTSIAALISAPDLVLQARNLSSEYFLPLPIFLTVGLMYFCICFPLSMGIRVLERKWKTS